MDPVTIGIIIGIALLGAGSTCAVKIYKDARLNKNHAEYQEKMKKAQERESELQEMIRKRDEQIKELLKRSKESADFKKKLAEETRKREELAKILEALAKAIGTAGGFVAATCEVAPAIGGVLTMDNRLMRSCYSTASTALDEVLDMADKVISNEIGSSKDVCLVLAKNAKTFIDLSANVKRLGK